jgi:hypothetical protein
MVKSQGMLESLKGTNGGERDEHLSVFIDLNRGGRREHHWGGERGINTPLGPNGQLSAALPLSECGTVALARIAKMVE